jgi:hypothetical protein
MNKQPALRRLFSFCGGEKPAQQGRAGCRTMHV